MPLALSAELKSKFSSEKKLKPAASSPSTESVIGDLGQTLFRVNNMRKNRNDALALFDKEWNLKTFNNVFANIGASFFSIKIKPGLNFKHILSNYPDLVRKVVKLYKKSVTGDASSFLIENHVNNIESYYCYELFIEPFYDEAREIGYAFLIYDISYEKWRSNEAFITPMSAKYTYQGNVIGELTSALVHEISQPLTVIQTYAQGCLSRLQQTSEHSDFVKPVEQIALQTKLVSQILTRMKQFVCDNKLYLENTNLNELIRKSMGFLCCEIIDLKIEYQFDPELPNIEIDTLKIMQVILNMGRNSIDAFQNHLTSSPKITIQTLFTGTEVQVHFRDNGPGIPTKIMDKISNPQLTTKTSGSSLGLTICQNLIQSHGGKLQINQHQDHGAWMLFTLPT